MSPMSSREVGCKHSFLVTMLQFGFGFHDPLTEALLHSLPASPASIVDRWDDLERLEPLDKPLHLQKAAVLAVWDSCQKQTKQDRTSSLRSLKITHAFFFAHRERKRPVIFFSNLSIKKDPAQ